MNAVLLAFASFDALLLSAILHVLARQNPESDVSPMTTKLAVAASAIGCVIVAVGIIMRAARGGL